MTTMNDEKEPIPTEYDPYYTYLRHSMFSMVIREWSVITCRGDISYSGTEIIGLIIRCNSMETVREH